MSKWGDWIVANIEKPFLDFLGEAAVEAEDIIDVVFEAAWTEIEKIGPGAIGQIITAALSASKNPDGSINLSSAISHAVDAAKTQGLAIGEAALTSGVAAGVAAYQAGQLGQTGTAEKDPAASDPVADPAAAAATA